MRFLFLLLIPLTVYAQPGPDNNPLKRMDCPTAGEIRNDAGTCVTLATYFSGQTLRHVGSGQTHSTIQAAVTASSATDVIVIHEGTYSESVTFTQDNLTFIEYPGDEVIWDGTTPINDGWTVYSGNIYRREYVYDAGGALPVFDPGCPDNWSACVRHFQNRELVFLDNDMADFQDTLSDVSSHGHYYVNGITAADNKTYTTDPDSIYIYLDTAPANYTLEFSVHEKLLKESGQNSNCANGSLTGLRIIGITFENSTPTWAQGMVCTTDDGSIIEESEFLDGGQVGLNAVGRNHLIRGNTATGNGFWGMGGGADTTLIEYNNVSDNAWRDTKARESVKPDMSTFKLTGTGSGGGKWAKHYADTLRHNIYTGNQGPGVWFDVDGADNYVFGNYVCDNLARGLFDESGVLGDAFGGMRRNKWINNVVCDTRYDNETDDGTGIKIFGAKYSKVFHNTVFNNSREGISVESKTAIAVPQPRGVKLYNNLVIGNNTDEAAQGSGGVEINVQDTTGHRLDGNIYQKFATAGNVWRFLYTGTVTAGNVLATWQSHWQTTVAGTGCDACEDNAQIISSGTQIIEDRLSEGWALIAGSPAINAAATIPDSLGAITTDFYGVTRSTPDVGAYEFVALTDRLAGAASGSVGIDGVVYTIVGDGHGIRSTSDEGQMLVSSNVGTFEWEVKTISANTDGIFGIVSGCARSSSSDNASIICIDVLTSNEATSTGTRLVRMTERTGGQPANATGFAVVTLPTAFMLELSGSTWTGKVDDDLNGTYETTLGSGTLTASEIGIIVARGRQGTGSVTAAIEWISP